VRSAERGKTSSQSFAFPEVLWRRPGTRVHGRLARWEGAVMSRPDWAAMCQALTMAR